MKSIRKLLAIVLASLMSLATSPGLWSPAFTKTLNPNPQAGAMISQPDQATKEEILDSFGRLPLRFELNQGQTADEVKFISRGGGYNLFLTSTEAVLALRTADCGLRNEESGVSLTKSGNLQSEINNPKSTVLRMQLLGANPEPKVSGLEEMETKSNYFLSQDEEKWHTNIPNYARVRYQEVYPGVDMVYYGNQGQLEYDFIVSPGADPNAIALNFEGADKLEIDDQGDLVLHTAGGDIRQHKPVVYQESNGNREPIAGHYFLKDGQRVSFQLTGYDASRSLVIDPTLSYSTYLGGNSLDDGRGIAVDSVGNVYVVGFTASTDFPMMNALQTTNNGSYCCGLGAAFITKLNAAGTALVYSTYLGSDVDDVGLAIAVDSAGNAYVTGDTGSIDFPMMNPLQATYGGGSYDAFVTKLNAAGNGLVYSTYLGGNTGDHGSGIAVDSAGNAYVTGATNSDDFPTMNPFQAAFSGGSTDAFVTKLNAAGNGLVYSTYLGGNDMDSGYGIAVDSAGNAYITGFTRSADFPMINALKATLGGGEDAFVTKLNPTGTPVYSTYLGGSSYDNGYGIAVDTAGNVYVTGSTDSPDFPTKNAMQTTLGGNGDVFVTKLNAAGTAMVYSTYLGGIGDDQGYGIAVDSVGNVYVTGATDSSDFPMKNPLQATLGANIGSDAFVTKLNASGTAMVYSTYMGGNGDDEGHAIALDSAGNAYVTGYTASTNFPMMNPIQGVNHGGNIGDKTFYDAFVMKISERGCPTITLTPTTLPNGMVGTFYSSQTILASGGTSPYSFGVIAGTLPPGLTLSSSGQLSGTPIAAGSFIFTILATDANSCTGSQVFTLIISETQADFSLVFNPSTMNVFRGQKGQIILNINRSGGFAGNVIVSAPDTKALKIKLTPPMQSTTGASVSFDFKVKKKAPVGTQQLTFTGKDDSGRVRTATLTLVIQ